jgi:hypothetical protein
LNFDNSALNNQYIRYFNYEKSNGVKLTFGENPLNIFQDYLSWLRREQNKQKEKLERTQSKELCKEIVKTLNEISGTMSSLPIIICPKLTPSVQIPIVKKNKKRIFKEQRKRFKCDFCPECFDTGQGLGGHMSRKHKDKSEKFKKKKEIRNRREHLRNLLIEAKKKLCDKFMIDYEELMKSRQGKNHIKKLINEHLDDYKKYRNELKRDLEAEDKNTANPNLLEK